MRVFYTLVNPYTVVFIKEKEQSYKIYRGFFLNALITAESFECVLSKELITLKSKLILSTSSTELLLGF